MLFMPRRSADASIVLRDVCQFAGLKRTLSSIQSTSGSTGAIRADWF
jgi:hypothetical protein